MIAPLDFDAILSERYGIEPTRTDVHAAKRLQATLAGGALDSEAIEAAMIAAAVNGDSHFLRHAEQFEWLRDCWLPSTLTRERPSTRPMLRVLSAGCSTGEEAYSLAATLVPGWPNSIGIEILGVDISEPSLATARAGNYGLWSLRELQYRPPDWLRVEGARVHVAEWVRSAVRFARHNLLEPLHELGEFDLLLCRNVLIYLRPDAVERVWRNLAAAIGEHGVLITAPADPPPPVELGLHTRWVGAFCVHQNCPRQPHKEGERGSLCAQAEPRRVLAPRPHARPTAAPHDSDRRHATIMRLVRCGELRVARELLLALLADEPQRVEAHILLALVASELGELEFAVTHARKASYLASEQPYVLFVVAAALEQLGHREQAEQRYRAVAELLADIDPFTSLPHADGLLAGQLQELLHGRA